MALKLAAISLVVTANAALVFAFVFNPWFGAFVLSTWFSFLASLYMLREMPNQRITIDPAIQKTAKEKMTKWKRAKS